MKFAISLPEGDIKRKWPNLTVSNHKKTSDEDSFYNCVSHAVEPERCLTDDKRCLWPIEDDAYAWPDGYPKEETTDNFVRTFNEVYGYEICSDGNLENGYEKVAIYILENKPVHLARQLTNGEWTSKIGVHEDISHNTLQSLEGDYWYGVVKVFMRKKLITSN